MTNTLTVTGWLGNKRCYLNVSEEEALRRFKLENPEGTTNVDTFRFDDEFNAYDAWGDK